MTLHRFFATGPVPDRGVLPISAADVHHLRDVLRLAVGDEIIVTVDGTGVRLRLTAVGKTVEAERVGRVDIPRLPRLTLVQGIAKGEKMDDVVRQVTELGIARVVPFAAERSVVKLDAAKGASRAGRWRRVAAQAAKQSRRADVPQVSEVVGFDGLSALLEGLPVVVCWEDAGDALSMGEALGVLGVGREAEVAIVVGPEGGLAAHEVHRLVASGAVVASLGATVLRTETAGVVACAIAMYELGGLGARRA